jgi:hypothetical protein
MKDYLQQTIFFFGIQTIDTIHRNERLSSTKYIFFRYSVNRHDTPKWKTCPLTTLRSSRLIQVVRFAVPRYGNSAISVNKVSLLYIQRYCLCSSVLWVTEVLCSWTAWPVSQILWINAFIVWASRDFKSVTAEWCVSILLVPLAQFPIVVTWPSRTWMKGLLCWDPCALHR